jgi:hypothetical protein
MNFQEPNRRGNLKGLNIPAPTQANERSMAVRIGSLERE